MSNRSRATRDFGAGGWRPREPFASPGLAVALAVGMGLVVAIASWLHQSPRHVAAARRWTILGPACPTLSAQAFARLAVKPRMAFQFDEMTFSRAYGHVYCDDVFDDGGRALTSHPACQFTGPAALEVTTAKGDFHFFPSTGRATVSVNDGVAHCVRGGWYDGGPNSQ